MSAIAGMAVEWADRPEPIDISFLYMSQEIRSRIQIVRQNQIVTGEYINATTRDQENCKVTILLYDEMGYADTLGVNRQSIISIHSFECGVPLEYKKKLLFCVLEYIRDKVRTKMHTTTVAFSKELGLEGIGAEEFYFDGKMVMEGEINKIMKACWPEKYTEPIHTPAPPAVFSSSTPSYYPSPSQSQSQSSYSGSYKPGSVHSTSVEPPDRSGGKKNNTNRKYTMKTRKNKKSKKRWSLKYKKSINCKRPRGFSQRQYCKYGRKKNLK